MKNRILVTLLDNSEVEFKIDKKIKGQTLFDKVCDHLQLLEKDYFGLAVQTKTSEARDWIQNDKNIYRQLKNFSPKDDLKLYFEVKFYPLVPVQLREDITRYFICLQIRRDVLSGKLPCSFVTHAQLGSFMVQSEIGDYDPSEHQSDYLYGSQFAPQQSKELEQKVAELHRLHRGMNPAEADICYLEIARKLSMYGVDLHPARDSSGIEILMGVGASGLLVYRSGLRINRFAWPKILKISYKRMNFFIRMRPNELDLQENTIRFKFSNMKAAKRYWKACVEHHTFFRLTTPDDPHKTRISLPRFGSKFRYSGRTQHQSRQASLKIERIPPEIHRLPRDKKQSQGIIRRPFGGVAVLPPMDIKTLEDRRVNSIETHLDSNDLSQLSRSQNSLRSDLIPSGEEFQIPEFEKALKGKQFHKPKEDIEQDDITEAEDSLTSPKISNGNFKTVTSETMSRKDTLITEEYDNVDPATYDELARQYRNSLNSLDRKSNRSKDKVISDEHQIFRQSPIARAEETNLDGPQSRSSSLAASPLPTTDANVETNVGFTDGEILSTESRTVETLTYKTEKDGAIETRVEHKITIKSDGDSEDHDRALAEAIQEATMMDPLMTVQKIEITQQSPLN